MTDNLETILEDEIFNPVDNDEQALLDDIMQPFNPTLIDIVSGPMSLDVLIKRMEYNEIDMNTDFQRHADLWDNHKMSRLIESILIRFPLPAFYFDASEDDKWLIVDGLQRLSSIKKFVIDKKLRLVGLEFLSELNGKTFSTLSRQYQRRIEECQVTVYTIRKGTPEEVKYSVFRRINTGGLTLNNQEIRNALAKGRDRQLLEELANLPNSRIMLGDLSKRMKDQELVLRFWAFYRFDYLDPKNKKDITSFLDKAMNDINDGDEKMREEFRIAYSIAIERCLILLGKSGFEKEISSLKRPKNSSLFEVWMVTLAKLSDKEFLLLKNNAAYFQNRAKELLNDNAFFNAITFSTQKKEHVIIRYDRVKSLIQEFLND